MMTKFAEERRRRGFSQRALANAAKVSPNTIYSLEARPGRLPHPQTARKLAEALKVTPGEIFDWFEVETGLPKAPALSPTALLERAGARTRLGALENHQWRARIERASPVEARQYFADLEEERRATFSLRQDARLSGDREEKDAAARLGFRYLTRGAEAARKAQDSMLAEVNEQAGLEELVGAA